MYKELLELAAKAAGIECEFMAGKFWSQLKEWNPLTDDGDALRLAVKLGLGIEFLMGVVEVDSVYHEAYESDRYAATRRCIVRAAAEIGRGME